MKAFQSRTIAVLCMAIISIAANAQLATSPKTGGINNPISPYNLCADPTGVEYNGRLYVYGTNDQQEFDASNGGNNTYGKINQLVCFSTADLVNWTFHGVIDTKSVCKWCWTSWAPSIASRVEADGKTHFYLYFTNGASGIGVMTATSPVGPWKDPIGRALIDGGTPGRGEMSNIIDPGVVIDENGTGWLTFGGGSPNKYGSNLQPGNARIVKLGKNMASLSGSIMKIPAPFHFEANELNKIGDYFVFSYSSNWNNNSGDWNSYAGKNGFSAPSNCSILQMRTKTPLDEKSWEYNGVVMTNPGNHGYPWGNNHTHVQQFGDKWYLLYHTQWLEQKWGKGSGYRGIAINSTNVTESTGRIATTKPTNAGATQLEGRYPSAYERIQAECLAQGAGFKMIAFSRAGNMAIVPQKGGWTMIRNMDFGGQQPKSVKFKSVKGEGTIEIRIGSKTAKPIVTIPVNSKTYIDIQADIEPVAGVDIAALTAKPKDVYIVFTEANNLQFDYWQFFTQTVEEITHINTPTDTDPTTPHAIYNLSGQRLLTPQPGLNIIDGKKVWIRE